ncbi:MAG: hypothetical protein ACR2IE_02110 [Candidatus Sumerlaeaceae bacterium]
MIEAFQCFVLFNEFPRMDAEALREYLVALEPEGTAPEVSEFNMRATEHGSSVSSGVVTCGKLNVAVQVHGHALPEETFRSTVEIAALPEDYRDTLRQHRVYASLTCLGSDEYHAIESAILLLKTSMGLIAQGGLAVVNENNYTCFPAEVMEAYADQAIEDAIRPTESAGEPPEADDGTLTSLWDSLRDEGMPGELLVGFLPAEVDGEIWFLSAGHTIYGLPELAYRAEDLNEIEDIDEHFKTIFYYMFENGPVVRPGQSLGYEESVAYHFSELPPERKNLEAPHGTLFVTIEAAEEE